MKTSSNYFTWRRTKNLGDLPSYQHFKFNNNLTNNLTNLHRFFALELCRASMAQMFSKDGETKKYSGPLPPKVDVLYQLAIGLEYIHKSGFIHRDIKPENVFIWVNPEHDKVLMKWADFGLSKQVNERGTCTMSGVKGTPDWMAPEILELLNENAEGDIRQRTTIKSDIFAEGLIFGYFLLEGVHPFGPHLKRQINIIKNKQINLQSKAVLGEKYFYI